MTTQRLAITLIAALCALGAQAQGRLVFAETEWDFGTIAEQDGPVTHTFTATNRDDKPVVILDAVANCGCTVPRFSKKPIQPGEKAEVEVTFNPADRAGAVSKDINIYISAREVAATLTIHGTITPRKRSLEELYPISAGGGLQLNTTLCAFSYIFQGQTAQASIGYANISDRTIRLTLRAAKASGRLKVDAPAQIAPRQSGEINFSYLIAAEKPYYGTLRDTFEVWVDGKDSGVKIVVHAIGVDKPTESKRHPKADLDHNYARFEPVKRTAGVQRQTITLSNRGDEALIVRAVETEGPLTTTLKAAKRIDAGRSAEFQIMFDPAHFDPAKQDDDVMTGFVTIVTNDPTRPMRKIRITAVIEK